jgi:NAD(P)-dependent dehydrogenase (short-subunit alcohol dehydrogenase family)
VGRVALVTGASRGIGAATAIHLAALGARVAITARTFDDQPDAALEGSLTKTLAGIERAGESGIAITADLTDEDDRARIVPGVEAVLGPIDILVNNAAAAMYAPIAELPVRRRRLLFEVNVHAPIDLAQAVLPGMVARQRGSIVNVTSRLSTGEKGPPYARTVLGTTGVAYGASKAALERFTVGLAAEVYENGIAVNAIAPVAAVRSEGAEALVGPLLADHAFEPMSYLVDAVAHLAECAAGDRTGQILTSQQLLRELGQLPA